MQPAPRNPNAPNGQNGPGLKPGEFKGPFMEVEKPTQIYINTTSDGPLIAKLN